MLANIITASRILFSLVLFTLSPSTYAFSVLYILCGISDVLDGFVARKLNTASERGARLDSAADIVFSLFYAVKILPLFDIPLYLWALTALIAATKIICILLKSKKAHKLSVEHTFIQKGF